MEVRSTSASFGKRSGESCWGDGGRSTLTKSYTKKLNNHAIVGSLACCCSRNRFRDELFDVYCSRLAKWYNAIREVSGCSVIVDSTKGPPSATLLRLVPSIELSVIHLVRDSRGVAFSWQKKGMESLQYAGHPVLEGQTTATR